MSEQSQGPGGFPIIETDEGFAQRLDERDPLREMRNEFRLPTGPDGEPAVYLCGNSLGLQPRGTAAAIEQELEDWARLAVDAHFDGANPWYSYHEAFREPAARLVGAEPREVVVMNSLTANLHLMMVSFYRPEGSRYKILMEADAFPSDNYAVRSQVRFHGYEPDDAIVLVRPREGEACLRPEDILESIEKHGRETALVLFPGVGYYNGQAYDLAAIAAAARKQGCRVGFDLAHAAGNLPLSLHDDGADFAVWCSYKYLNAGPGAVAGCFVHARNGGDRTLPRFAGWWGNDPKTRFRMHLEEEFVPVEGADGWQLSNPPVLALAPLRASLALFDRAGMTSLRAKSVSLTGYMAGMLDKLCAERVEVITPADSRQRGCQLSLKVRHERPREVFEALQREGVVGDYREPGVIRVAPVPLYNTFHDAWRFVQVLDRATR